MSNTTRRWIHEIPPVAHKSRGAVIDLHHTILPPTAAPRVNADRLFEALYSTPMEGVFALSPCDQIIHSATHLFYESEFHHALRDLWDLHQLLCALAGDHPDGEGTTTNMRDRARRIRTPGQPFRPGPSNWTCHPLLSRAALRSTRAQYAGARSHAERPASRH